MAIVSTFCKKGGVGKTTLIGYLAHYHAMQGKTVLVISVDDQNSIFKLFGKDGFIDERQDNYFEHYLAGETKREEIVCEARDGMYLIKTLNTDTLSLNLTLQRAQEKAQQTFCNRHSARTHKRSSQSGKTLERQIQIAQKRRCNRKRDSGLIQRKDQNEGICVE